jgi:PEGA domain
MPYHLGPVGVVHASFWTDADQPARDGDRQGVSPDSLSLFPHEPESTTPRVPEVRRVAPDRVQLDPMVRTMQARLSAIEAELEQLRSLAARVANEHRRIEHARLEAAHSLKVRERVLRNEAPYVVQGDIVTEEIPVPSSPRYELARHSHNWNVRKLRANTTALVEGMLPRPVRLQWPRFAAPEWLLTAPRHVVDYAAAAGAFALLVIAALTISPGDGVLRRDLPRVPAIAQLDAPAVPTAPIEVAPARLTTGPTARALAAADQVAAAPRQIAGERNPMFIGTLAVRSEPAGAAVFVNREYVGATPLNIPRVRAGSHVVWVEGDGYRRWTDSVLVPADKVTRVNVNLQRSPDEQR